MSAFNNFPETAAQHQNKSNHLKNLVIGFLSVAVVAIGAYAIYNKNAAGKTMQQQENKITGISEEKSSIQSSFDASLARLDSMSTVNTGLKAELTDKKEEITKVKSEIRSILNKKNASVAELAKAKSLIASLNGKISAMETVVANLTSQNRELLNDKTFLIEQKDILSKDLVNSNLVKKELEQQVDIASTLNASNITITSINVKSSGEEKVSTTAKRVDKLLISFDVNNRIARNGTTDVYVLVLGPDGVAMNTGLATFSTRDEGEKSYTAKVPVEIETAKKKNVEFGFVPGTTFQKGNYKILIYQNGFLIGEGSRELKKGGLFS